MDHRTHHTLAESALLALLRLDDHEEREAAVRMLSVWGQEALAEERYERAVACFEALVAFGSEHEGPTAPTTMVWRGFLGRALTEARRCAEAEDVLGDLLVDRERVLGPNHELTLVTRGNLARSIALGGRPEEGILLARRLLDDRLQLLGADHPSTLDSRGHIAQFTLVAGRAAEAAAMYEALLADRIRVLDADNPAIEQTQHNLDVARRRAFGDGH